LILIKTPQLAITEESPRRAYWPLGQYPHRRNRHKVE